MLPMLHLQAGTKEKPPPEAPGGGRLMEVLH